MEETQYPFPTLNRPAPDFEAVTTHGPRKLSDYRGKWLVLFSHPADFTPVCTTEFIGFAQKSEEFRRLNCELLGLSIDSNNSHLAWIRNIQDNFGVEVPFPIIADINAAVAHSYGMIQPGSADTTTVRALFVIDDKGILKAMIYYPLTNGRSIGEVVRLVEALQTTASHSVSTPEGWTPGEKVMVPPPATAEDAASRKEQGFEYTDWYFCRKTI